jgi:hypothetical protein
MKHYPAREAISFNASMSEKGPYLRDIVPRELEQVTQPNQGKLQTLEEKQNQRESQE